MADVGRNGREGFSTLAICLIETRRRRSSRRTRVRVFTWNSRVKRERERERAGGGERGREELDRYAQREEEGTREQYVPRLYYYIYGVAPACVIPGGRLLFPRSYRRPAPRRRICDRIRCGGRDGALKM